MKNLIETLEKYYEDGLLYKQTHPTLPLTIWNYTPKVQYENIWDEITLQCRGMVTDDNGNVVALISRRVNTLQPQSLRFMRKWMVLWGYSLIMKVNGCLQLVVHSLQNNQLKDLRCYRSMTIKNFTRTILTCLKSYTMRIV
jgi:hypothetical protein